MKSASPAFMTAHGAARSTVLLFAAAFFLHQPTDAATLDPSGVDEANVASASVALGTTSSIADLEKVFWICDYAATTHGVDRHQAATCASATDELKQVKFGGSFEKLLEWWRLNKVAQHRALQPISPQ